MKYLLLSCLLFTGCGASFQIGYRDEKQREYNVGVTLPAKRGYAK